MNEINKLENAINKIKDKEILEKTKKIFDKFKIGFSMSPAARNNHCNYIGGLAVHTYNVMKYCYELCKDDELDEMLYLAFIHDLGKIKVYRISKDIRTRCDKIEYASDIDHVFFTLQLLSSIGITLSDDELNAIVYHHGGWSLKRDWIKPNRYAILLHAADMLAIRQEESENWSKL